MDDTKKIIHQSWVVLVNDPENNLNGDNQGRNWIASWISYLVQKKIIKENHGPMPVIDAKKVIDLAKGGPHAADIMDNGVLAPIDLDDERTQLHRKKGRLCLMTENYHICPWNNL